MSTKRIEHRMQVGPAREAKGTLLIKLEDVAQMAGVSVSTASRALTGKGQVSKQTVKRVQRAAASLGYQPNELARGLKMRSSRLIGLAVHNIFNPTYQCLAQVIQERLARSNYQIILCITNDSVEQEALYLETLLNHRIEGLIAVPTGSNVELFKRVSAAGVPVVTIIRRHREDIFDAVLQADTGGAAQGTEYLIRMGHRRIGFIVGPEDTTSGRERLAGYKQALGEAGIELDPALIHQGPYSVETGIESCRALLQLEQPITALFCANHEASGGVLRVLSEQKVSIPQELSVLCYEDSPAFVSRHPSISVMDNDPAAIAEYAVDLLMRALQREAGDPPALAPRELRVGNRLIVRGSCAPPKKSKE